MKLIVICGTALFITNETPVLSKWYAYALYSNFYRKSSIKASIALNYNMDSFANYFQLQEGVFVIFHIQKNTENL